VSGADPTAWLEGSPGHRQPSGVVTAHADPITLRHPRRHDRVTREEFQDATLAPVATRARGAGNRLHPEEPDPYRTCFERDRDRILHSPAFRRLAGKTQVFIFPRDHQRTRLTHALEVAQVATAISRRLGLNDDLTEAIAIGHDCGHGPGGHASEEAFAPYLPDGFDHAPWGAYVTLARLNLTAETIDGIAHHSWSLGTPATPEGEVVSLADRIAYCAHDLEDAIEAQMVARDDLPREVRALGDHRNRQLDFFIRDVTETSLATGTIGLSTEAAHLLGVMRRFNWERIYQAEASLIQRRAVIEVLQRLVETLIERPSLLPEPELGDPLADASPATRAVAWVAGMTDRFAFSSAVELAGFPPAALPRGIDAPR
jgi:dGTPase